ncbi:MAG: phenylalanine--tRNA ligase subunit beta [Sphaerochaetaceae bacterium]|nr:phenylalanine--tRNA ligase subunit beta [Sphaerochaetaceae bacterium]
MPKIETTEKLFFDLLGRTYTDDELEMIFPRAKAELDGHDKENHTIKIELNDTNRPDLWSAAGIARLLSTYESEKPVMYDFFSTKEESLDNENRELIIGENAEKVRPFSIGFASKGQKITEEILLALIQSQEKICFNFGKKRKTVAMGIYRSNLIKYPIHYDGVDPDSTKFVPLGMDEKLSLREICEKHPKGKEYGYIVSDKPVFPYLYDDDENALSFPPVINSARIGAVEVGDSQLFFEFSGPNLKDLLLSAAIIACDISDFGFEILPVKVKFPEATEFGTEITVPYYFQSSASCDLDFIRKTLGENFSENQIIESLKRMGIYGLCSDNKVYITVPEYRNDFMHGVDIVEEVMIGYGLNNFEPIMPGDFTIGRLTSAEELARKVKDIMVGLGFQEMIYNYLGSKKQYIENMNIEDNKAIHIMNPMSENYEIVRPSIIPNLLESESISGHAVYPHKIFEVGKIAFLEPEDNSGTITENSLGFLVSNNEIGFNEAYSMVNTLLYFLKKEYKLEPLNEDNRFILGRCANICINEKVVGCFGEINPAVLENWGISMPTIAGEIDLDLI